MRPVVTSYFQPCPRHVTILPSSLEVLNDSPWWGIIDCIDCSIYVEDRDIFAVDPDDSAAPRGKLLLNALPPCDLLADRGPDHFAGYDDLNSSVLLAPFGRGVVGDRIVRPETLRGQSACIQTLADEVVADRP